jgi:release factor glutamine methyltransferase
MLNVQEILEAIGKPPNHVYAPGDDTFLMIDALSTMSLRDKEALDMGTGSGVLGLVCTQMGAHVTVTDIEDSALENAKAAAHKLNLTVKAAKSDIFSNVTARFDIVLFNPPYLPSDEVRDTAVDGGSDGRQVMNRFLKELPLHLKKDGFALLLLSSLNEPRMIIDSHPELAFKVVATRSLFFEELQVLLCKLRNFSS